MSAALQTLQSIYPQKFAPHPHIIIGCLILGLVLLLATGVMWTMERAEKHESAAVPLARASNEVGHIEQKDIGAKAIGNQLTVNFQAGAPAFAPQSPVPPESVLPRPHFELGLVKDCRVDVEGTVVQFVREGGMRSLTLSARNIAEGKQAVDARSVFATLEFNGLHSRFVVNRACWIGHGSNEVAIDVYQTGHILIGFPVADEWVTFNNPNKVDLRLREYWDEPQELEKRTLNWGVGALFTVEVRIVSCAVGTRGETFAHKRFKLERMGIYYSAGPLE